MSETILRRMFPVRHQSPAVLAACKRLGAALGMTALATTAFATAALAAATGPYHLAQRQHLDGATRWDYLSFDAASHLLYITHVDRVEVFDTVKKSIIGEITGLHGVHGVALAPELDRGFASNGADATVTVFALSSRKVLATVATGKNPDAIVYDPASRRVFAANGGAGSMTVIDATTNHAVGTVALGGRPEFAAVDGNGKLFVNLEDRNIIAVIDTRSLALTARYDVSAACDEPAGLAIDPQGRRLFVGCHNRMMAVVESDTGRIVDKLPIGRGSDATAFDASLHRAFSSNGDGTLDIVEAGADGHYVALQSLPTQAGARTMALDPVTHAVYLTAAEVDHVAAPTAAAPHPRPTLKPNTFTLLTVLPRQQDH